MSPLLPTDGHFYYSSVGAVEWGEGFCKDYNEEVERLVKKHGLPSWAPSHRRRSLKSALGALKDHPIENWRDLTPEKGVIFVSAMVRFWERSSTTDAIAYLPGDDLLIFHRNAFDSGREFIDIIDMRCLMYMTRYIVDDGAEQVYR